MVHLFLRVLAFYSVLGIGCERQNLSILGRVHSLKYVSGQEKPVVNLHVTGEDGQETVFVGSYGREEPEAKNFYLFERNVYLFEGNRIAGEKKRYMLRRVVPREEFPDDLDIPLQDYIFFGSATNEARQIPGGLHRIVTKLPPPNEAYISVLTSQDTLGPGFFFNAHKTIHVDRLGFPIYSGEPKPTCPYAKSQQRTCYNYKP